MKKIKNYLKLMRVKHYIKNLLLFLPIFFSQKILNLNLLLKVFMGFICFSFASSVIYIINDIRDIDNDKKHEIKKNRPLASGVISINNALLLLSSLIIIIILINCFFIKDYSWYYLLIYIILNLLYSFGLKNKPIIDVFILSFGFLIRTLYGSLLLSINISNWLYLTVLAGSLFFSIGKRRNELKKVGTKSRNVLENYNIDFLDKNMYTFFSLTLVFYSLWVIDLNLKYLVCSVPIIFSIFMRYSYDIENESSYGDPVDVLLNDKLLIALCFLFVIIMVLSFYIYPMVI